MLRVPCPRCGKMLSADEKSAGRTGRCPGCGGTVTLPVGGTPDDAAGSESPDEEIPVGIHVPDEAAQTVPPKVPPPLPPRGTTDDARRSGRPDEDIPVSGQLPDTSTPARRPRASHSLGVGSLILGILALLICWIPFLGILGMPLSALGLLLGFIGLALAALRKGAGIGYSIAGVAVCGLALVTALCVTYAVSGALQETVSELSEKHGTRQTAVPTPSWVDASKAAVQQGNIRVRVSSVAIDYVEVTSFGGVKEVSKEKQLLIRLQIENTSQTRFVTAS